jgi:copper(I)-binding protein
MMNRSRTPRHALLVVGAAVLALTGCADSTTTTQTDSASQSSPASAADSTALPLTVTDPWAKAADSGMTAVFGTITNESDADVQIVSATTSAPPMTELHEVVADANGQMVMQPKQGGFTVPAGGSLTLAPGKDHIMVMDLTTPIKPGDEVEVTMTSADGRSVKFSAPARTFPGAGENYQSGSPTDSGMSMTSTP